MKSVDHTGRHPRANSGTCSGSGPMEFLGRSGEKIMQQLKRNQRQEPAEHRHKRHRLGRELLCLSTSRRRLEQENARKKNRTNAQNERVSSRPQIKRDNRLNGEQNFRLSASEPTHAR